MSDFAKRLAALSPEQRALLEKRLNQKKAEPNKQQIPQVERLNRSYPLSFAQERLWLMYQLDPQSALYNVPVVIRFGASFDVALEQRVFQAIIERHEILRTTFTTVDQQPVQILGPAPDFKLPVIDLRSFPEEQQASEAQKHTLAEAQKPFDLSNGPLLRVVLLRLTHEHHLIINLHHIVSDDWSPGVLVQEIGALHQAFSQGQPSPLAPLAIQYLDFALWQRQRLEQASLSQQLHYWQNQLSGSLPLLALPTDRPRPRIQTFKGAKIGRRMPARLLKALKQLTAQTGATLFMSVLAAYKILLQRYTGQTDLLIGTPITSRTRPELEPLIGCFINMLVLRSQLDLAQTSREFIQQVRQMALDAYANAEVPFERLVQVLRPERNPSYTPIFQAAYILQDPQEARQKMPANVLGYAEVDTGTAKFDLTLEIDEVDGELATAFVYNTDLFDQTTVERMLGHLQQILETMVAQPDLPIAAIELVTPAERQQLLIEWNATETAFEADFIQHAIARHAQSQPNQLALRYGDQQYSYAELNQQADRLATYLQQLGVAPERVVGLCVERTPTMVIAILAIFKAGGLFLPLDPSFPADRLAYIVDDAKPLVVLTTADLAAGLALEAPHVIALDQAWPPTEQQIDVLDQQLQPSNLAYMIYTSGTTGTPKAVLVTHQNLLNVLLASQQGFGFNAHDVMPCIAPFSFDIFLFELLNPLLAGGTSWMLTREEILDIPNLIDSLAAMSVIHTVPSLMRQLVNALEAEGYTAAACRSIRMIFIGGDLVPPELLSAMRLAFPQAAIHVLYGPTEATIICTSYRVPQQGTLERHLIGRPLPNLAIRLYDPQQNLVPIGMPGELYIGGAGVSRGYLNRPELTNEKFVELDQQRWYRTGDLARYQVDGNLEFLGRIDQQVKIRGFRIELGEIESVLAQHPSIREAVVIAREDLPGDKRLVAYLIAESEQTPHIGELRAFLQTKLPEYMLPSAFMLLEALPLTRNGKVDRQALPVPPTTREHLANQFAAPTNHLETLLSTIWAEVLGREQVGIHDNFFELGGDSILSLQIVARLNQAGYHVLTKDIFQYQTIAELAQVVSSTTLVVADQGLIEGDVPLTPIQQWFFRQSLANPHYFNSMPVLLDAPAALNQADLRTIIAQLLQHHDGLRLRFEFVAGQWQQTHGSLEAELPLAVVDLKGLNQTEQTQTLEATAIEYQTKLNLSTGPLIWFVLFEAELSKRLLIVAHHLVFDGISLRILLEDLQTAYTQLQAEQSITLPLKTSSFKTWALALQEHAQSPEVAQQASYWQTIQQDQSPLPLDHSGQANTEASSSTILTQLEVAETDVLLNQLPTLYHASLEELLLTALAQTIGEWTYSQRLVVDLENHGRAESIAENLNLSRTIGWFTSLYPVVLDWTGFDGPLEMLKVIKDNLRQVPEHGLSYGLWQFNQPDPMLNSPAELRFNYLGQLGGAAQKAAFELLPQLDVPLRDPASTRSHVLDVDVVVVQQQLRVRWTYSNHLHEPATITQLAERFMAALRDLLQGDTATSAAYVPSDFPMANLDQQTLNSLMKKLR